MRVLHVHKDFQPLAGGGGTARHIHGLAQVLVERGAQVRVVAPDATPNGESYEVVRASAAGLKAHVDWADVVHVHGARSKYAVAGAVLAKVAGKPFFYTPHAFYVPRNAVKGVAKWVWDRTAEKFLLERGQGTILLTEYWRGWLRDHGISPTRTTIIPNCVLERDLTLPPAEAPPLPGNPAILTIGRLDPVKRVDDVIRALATPGLQQAHFHIVGKGAERESLELLARNEGVSDRVTFHGFVDDAGVAAMMRGADVFVLASEQEGLPTVLLEALLAGFPIVCTQIPGNLAITEVAGVTATYPVGDISALSGLLADARAIRVPDGAAEKLRRHFTWEYRADDIMNLYRNPMGARSA
jgi:glycosyltransferase involved in cell wall biosynthesis